jgi:multiple sugar transport system ATP-binding protein
VREPSLFLFDEPLSNLDALLRVEMRTELKKLHQRMGRTTVYVTHDQIEAMTLATRIAVLDKGIIQQLGTPHEVYNRPANIFVATFIGSPRINLVPAVSRGGRVALDGSDVALPVPDEFGNALREDGRKLTVGIRPESYGVGEGGANGHTVDIDVDVSLIEPTGSDDVVFFRHPGMEQAALLRAGLIKQTGKTRLRVDTSRLNIFDRASGERLA